MMGGRRTIKKTVGDSASSCCKQKTHNTMIHNNMMNGLVLFIALRPQTLKLIRGDWSHYTEMSEPVFGNEAQNMVTYIRVSNQGLFDQRPNTLTNCANRAYNRMTQGSKYFIKVGDPKYPF
jgi:hypothetical protein